ncbi:MAG TPA: hypothetical protein DEO65_14050 [Bacillus bacterium]|uniref:hypothetical protein n=1 Tax=Siminovitchia fordii TaxID=254759 RepID=UPI00037BF27E|nr:hypothetical protein [Siminovitchia fordii]HBZ10971.1 hypothetical protein [Bacillus sp. (in: firmicutes)]
MKSQRKALKKQLDNEMNHITFSKQQEVMDSLRPITFKQKARLIWNKEIELPLLPLTGICMLICLSLGVKYINNYDSIPDSTEKKAGELIEIEDYVYWKEDLEKTVMRYED